MKKIILSLFAIAATIPAPAAVPALPTVDFLAIAQAMIQVALTSNAVDIARQSLYYAGNPVEVIISSASQTLAQFSQPGIGKPLSDIQTGTTGQSGQAYDGNGLYTSVQPDISLIGGRTVTRPIEPYRKHEALQKSVADYNAVIADTQTRRDALRDLQRRNTEQLQAATTDAEVQKLKAVLAAQQSELNNVAAERSEAAAKVAIQQAANAGDQERQAQADDEVRAASIQSALRDALRFFNADSRPLLLPDPKRTAL